MSIPELSLPVRTRGRAPSQVTAVAVRDIEEADLALLASGRGVTAPTIVKLRDRHHALARVLAMGKSEAEASAITGYCSSRISILKASPAFKELVANYREMNDAAVAEFVDRTTIAALTAINELQDRMEDDENPMAASMLLEIAKFAADRTGHAPVTKVQQTNINVDLGGRLAAARSRLEAARLVSATIVEDE